MKTQQTCTGKTLTLMLCQLTAFLSCNQTSVNCCGGLFKGIHAHNHYRCFAAAATEKPQPQPPPPLALICFLLPADAGSSS